MSPWLAWLAEPLSYPFMVRGAGGGADRRRGLPGAGRLRRPARDGLLRRRAGPHHPAGRGRRLPAGAAPGERRADGRASWRRSGSAPSAGAPRSRKTPPSAWSSPAPSPSASPCSPLSAATPSTWRTSCSATCLGVSQADLLLIAGLGVAVLAVVVPSTRSSWSCPSTRCWRSRCACRSDFLQNLLLVLIAVVIVVSIQAVGVALVLAMLVTPAAAAYLLTRRLPSMMATAAAIGAGVGRRWAVRFVLPRSRLRPGDRTDGDGHLPTRVRLSGAGRQALRGA